MGMALKKNVKFIEFPYTDSLTITWHTKGFLFGKMFLSNTVAMATANRMDDWFFYYLQAFLELFSVKYFQSWQSCKNCLGKHFNEKMKSSPIGLFDIRKTFNNKKKKSLDKSI